MTHRRVSCNVLVFIFRIVQSFTSSLLVSNQKANRLQLQLQLFMILWINRNILEFNLLKDMYYCISCISQLFPYISSQLLSPPLLLTAHLCLSRVFSKACFGHLFHYLEKSEPPLQVQDTIITIWTIRHPTYNCNDQYRCSTN
jgi:hypothetical protein